VEATSRFSGRVQRGRGGSRWTTIGSYRDFVARQPRLQVALVKQLMRATRIVRLGGPGDTTGLDQSLYAVWPRPALGSR
jgi:hypothetical protein